jgi:isopenicillin-N N-acyltransferase-like protein
VLYPKPQVLELDATKPRQCGQHHGETLREAIHTMAEVRLGLMLKETHFRSKDEVFEISRAHLPVLEQFDDALYQELLGIAEGAKLLPEQIVVLNHYTDMRDIDPRTLNLDPGGCSALYLPTPTGPVLGQTWDVHGTALDHVLMLRIKQHLDDDPSHKGDTLVFTVAGCLGMTGFNHAGLGVTINNLNSIDARIGLVWPALVRKILRQKNVIRARDIIMDAPLGSGHHYIVADKHDVFGIETSGTLKKITQSGASEVHMHTNHCLDAHMAKTHAVRPGSTTHLRYAELGKLLSEHVPTSTHELYEALGRVSIPKDPNAPELTATCGALVMNLKTLEALACKGSPSESIFHNPPLTLELRS